MYHFDYRVYHRLFRHPLKTHHGLWTHRQGILVQLTDSSGHTRYGEIAPLPTFGSETLLEALTWCQACPNRINVRDIYRIPSSLPATRFGVESAYLDYQAPSLASVPLCGLLPTGSLALEAWGSLWQQGYRTFKWKIGVHELITEQQWCDQLLDQLPPTARLRLDANGGLTRAETQQWLQWGSDLRLECLEQPLPPSEFTEMVRLQGSRIPIALDESITRLDDLKTSYDQGWRELVVLKPSILGFPSEIKQVCQQYKLESLYSSVLETGIGWCHAIRLVREILSVTSPTAIRALGFGIHHFFPPDAFALDPGPVLSEGMDPLPFSVLDTLWPSLSKTLPPAVV